MQHTDIPSLIPIAFASTGSKRAVPTLAADIVAANQPSLEAGFPPVTMIPKAAGGIPPAGPDMNGVLNLLSAANRWNQAGGLYPYNSAFSASIGGYPKGAILLSADGATVWQSTTENNATNPDSGGSAGWRQLDGRADYASTAAGKGASLVGIEDAGNLIPGGTTVEAALQWLAGTGRGYLLVTQFADLATAHAAATAAGVPLCFPAGVYNAGANSFSIDLTRTEWRDLGGASIQWTGAPAAGYCVRLTGTSTYLDTYKQARELRIPSLLGSTSSATKYNATALMIGDGANYVQSLDIRTNIQGFVTCVYYQDNTWWITLRGRFLWGNISTNAAATNHGEAMVFEGCTFADGCVIDLNAGDWTFVGGSLDNSKLVAGSAVQVAWYRPHLENPGSATAAPLMIDVAGVEASVALHDVHLVYNDPDGAGTTNITDAPFRVSSANVTAGLEIHGIQYSQGPLMNFTTNDDYIALVRSGGGRSIINGARPRAYANAYYVLGSDKHTQLANGGFEGASLNPWQSSGTGTAAQDTAHITGKRITSAKSAKLTTATATPYVQISQTVKCTTSDFVTFQVWAKGDGVAGHDGQLKIDFLDGQGGSISGSALAGAVVSSGSTWSLYRLAAFAPAGAQFAYITLSCNRTSADGSVYFDEAILNVG